MTSSPSTAATAGTPVSDESNAPHPSTRSEAPHQNLFSAAPCCAERRRRQGPPAATRSGYARALTPTPQFGVPDTYGESQRKTSRPLDRPRSFRDDLAETCLDPNLPPAELPTNIAARIAQATATFVAQALRRGFSDPLFRHAVPTTVLIAD